MDNDVSNEYDRLKKNFIEAERAGQRERECLVKVINTFGTVVAMHPEFRDEYRVVKSMVNSDSELATQLIEKEVETLRSRIFSLETERGVEGDGADHIDELNQRLIGACRALKRVFVVLVDDFYPVGGDLKTRADAIDLNCHEDMAQGGLDEAVSDFLSFLRELKAKISQDFTRVNSTFVALLENTKELERALTSEFDEKVRMKDIEQFEMKVSGEVGSIADLFDIHQNIDAAKRAVLGRLDRLKALVSERKEEEMKKMRRAFGVIGVLKKRIFEAEKGAHEMTRRAKQFQAAAQKDGLTGLYNRSAFDRRLKDAADAFAGEGQTFSVLLMDVDNFKWINDTFGHVAGDKVLQKVAECLKSTFRKNDFVARLGGDEFAVVIEGISEKMTRERVSMFNQTFRKKRFVSKNKGNISVTISSGIAVASAGERPADVLHRADMDMYAQKKRQPEPA